MWQSRLFFLLGCWILLISSTQLIPFLVAAATRETDSASGFLASMMVCFVVGGSLYFGFRSSSRIKVARLTLLLPIVGGISLGFATGLPFFFIFPDQGIVTAFFEGISLITTTGASAYEGAYEDMRAITLWRALASWIGGFLAICLALSILTALNSGGIQMHRSPLPFGDSETGYPRLRAVAVAVGPLYILVTTLCCVLLLIMGMGLFDALLFSMSTVSTSGIAPNGGNRVEGGGIQLVLTVFMLISMLNWDIMRTKLLGLKVKHPYGTETRSVIFLASAAAIALIILVFPVNPAGVWHGIFTAVSAMSTTGFVPADMEFTGGGQVTAAIVFTVLACLGGAVASTTGGVKQLRLIIIYYLGRREVDRLAHPHGVKAVKYQSFNVEKRDIEAAWLLIGAFVLSLVAGSLALAVLGVNFQTALAMAVSALTLSGPLITLIDPHFTGFPGLTDADYLILSTLMLLGRVEASVFLVLLTRSFWRG